MNGDYHHVPVMTDEVVTYLRVIDRGLYVDCTLGGGGHSEAVLERGGCVVGIDRDPEAVAAATERLAGYGDRFRALVTRFSLISEIAGIGPGTVDGIVMDLGVSSAMIDNPERGFSYRHDGPLDMAMGGGSVTARDILMTGSEQELARIFRDYGEERHASRIARAAVSARTRHPIDTTGELARVIEQSVPYMPHKSMARIFQALRIAVNEELNELKTALESAERVLGDSGRLCVISYHSLEDRIVKNFMRERADPCICPSDLPVCNCGRVPVLKLVTRKAQRPSAEEVASNSRARSALLRVAEKLPGGEA